MACKRKRQLHGVYSAAPGDWNIRHRLRRTIHWPPPSFSTRGFSQDQAVILNPAGASVSSISSRTTSATRAPDGPRRSRSTIFATRTSGPLISAVTDPSSSLRTQPLRPSFELRPDTETHALHPSPDPRQHGSSGFRHCFRSGLPAAPRVVQRTPRTPSSVPAALPIFDRDYRI